jgi:hypothetical protein
MIQADLVGRYIKCGRYGSGPDSEARILWSRVRDGDVLIGIESPGGFVTEVNAVGETLVVKAESP